MTTTPVQKPGPPIWVASMGDQSVAWTARRGYHLAAGAGRGHAKYEELLVQFGHGRSKRQVASIPIRVHLAETGEQAWDEAEAGLHQVLHFYRTRVDPQSATSSAGVLSELPPVGEFRNVPAIGHRGTPFVVGTPDEVGRALAVYRDRRLSHLSLNFHQPGMETNAVRRSMETFAKELMPAIKAW
jgi:alkanesulfonate monooxygenase SsuD/methylene tetrahydromethanopterin reductase-like flavin-dependent oxidoreductase (luciferase family)